ncbi:MAG: hypothetical protein ACOY4U_00030, partial [Pseudomonadota bacterium]
MSRKKQNVPAPIDESFVDIDRLTQDHQAAAEIGANARTLALQLNYEGSLTVGGLEDEIRFYQRRSVEAVLELGKRLLLLKELTPHGEFTGRIELLGINERMARRFMSATVKFSKTDTKSVLAASGNQTKLLELAVLDDEEIEELDEGGSARGITLDDIACMSVTELRAALREAKQDAEAKDKVLADKNQKLDELDKKLRRRKEVELVPWDERVGDLNGECSMIAVGIEELLEKFWIILQAITAAQFENDERDRARAMLAKNFCDRAQRIVDRVAF